MKKAFRMREELDPAGKIAELDENEISVTSEELVGSIRPLIEQTKARLAQSVNSELVLLYWHIGRLSTSVCQPRTGPSMGRKLSSWCARSSLRSTGKAFVVAMCFT